MTEPTTGTDASSAALPDRESAATILGAALGQIQWARQYTLGLLAATPQELWFERPGLAVSGLQDGDEASGAGQGMAGQGGEPGPLSTHIAWQVGHLAVSQYGLLMFRIHGRRDGDTDLIPGPFRKAFGRGSDPTAVGPAKWSPAELLDRLAAVHHRAIEGLRDLQPEVLLQSVDMPYAVYPIKLGAILFCPLHEHIHSGQIGLIRRCLGLAPVR